MLAAALFATLLIAAGQALAENLRDMPGYVDLEWIKIPAGSDEVQDIELGAALLGIAAGNDSEQDEALLRALQMIKSIRVKSWSTAADDQTAAKAIAKVAEKLAKDEWKRLIYVKDDEETVTVSTRYEKGRMVGMMLVTYKPGDMVTFVNVVGDLDLPTLFRLVKDFDEGSIEDMLGELEGVEGIEINRHDH
jgi:hypothetical protein